MNKIIFIKNNKGGVGKSTISKNISSGLAAGGFKTALVSFDSQNDSLTLLGKDFKEEKGIKAMVINNEDIKIKIRENLDYFPLETDVFSSKLKDKLKTSLNELKETYDFVIIDGAPSKDSFLSIAGSELADEILIPIELNKLSIKGISRLLQSVDAEKIAYIVPNKYKRGAIEKEIFGELQEFTAGLPIFLSEPIQESAMETNLSHKGKSIFETKAKKAMPLQKKYLDLIKEVIGTC